MEEVAEPCGAERFESRQHIEDVRNHRLGRISLDAFGGCAQAVGVQIEERDRGIGDRPRGAIEEVAGAHSDVEVTIGDIAVVQPAQLGRRAAPKKPVGEPQDHPVIGS